MLDSARLVARFAGGLPRFLRDPLTPEACRARVEAGLKARETNFLRVVEHAVLAQPRSPYRRLLAHAGIGLGDVRHALATRGLEGTLGLLHDEGVHVRLDEFKGRRPIRRGSLELPVASHDFDNPLAVRHVAVQTGGSRGAGTRIYLDLAHFAQDAAYDHWFNVAHGLTDRPYALWRPTPPWSAGIKGLLSHAKLGLPVERWFSQRPLPWRGGRGWQHGLITAYVVLASRAVGRPLPMPEHVPLDQAVRVARWAAEKAAAGRPALINTNAASGVRVCAAALEHGLDIAGTRFRLGGEPFTAAKARVVREAGAVAACHYTMGEIGRIGLACARPEAVDDVHLITDKVALIRRERPGGHGVPVNVYTTLLPTTPKLMLNAESGDYGILEERRCGCAIEALGYGLHLHTVRAVDKLTSEGMNFLGDDLVRLLEEVLPQRFGGRATDWQLVEEEEGGLPKVSLVASPRIGPLDAGAVQACVVGFLNGLPRASDDLGERWREGGTLRLVRREPHATGPGKVLSLHVARAGAGTPAA